MTEAKLKDDEIARYSRQLILSNWSAKKQLRLRSLNILVSHPVTGLYLAAAGAGRITLFGSAEQEPPMELLAELNPQTSFSSAKMPLCGATIDCAVLYAEERLSLPCEIPTFIVSEGGISRHTEGQPELVLAFDEDYRQIDRRSGGFGAAALSALALLDWLAECFDRAVSIPQ